MKAVKGYAKINLHLDVTGRREDGFHTVKTVIHYHIRDKEVYHRTDNGGDLVSVNEECDDDHGGVHSK